MSPYRSGARPARCSINIKRKKRIISKIQELENFYSSTKRYLLQQLREHANDELKELNRQRRSSNGVNSSLKAVHPVKAVIDLTSSSDEESDDERRSAPIFSPIEPTKKGPGTDQNRYKKSTVTRLVQACFKNIFPDQMENVEDNTSPVVPEAKKNNPIKPCQVEEVTSTLKIHDQRSGCPETGDSAKMKRKLSNNEDGEKKKKKREAGDDKVTWQSEGEEFENKTYFTCAQVGDEFVYINQFLSVKSEDKIGLVKYMYEDVYEKSFIHLHWFVTSNQTILGDTGRKQELFMTEKCDDIDLSDVDSVIDVNRLSISAYWRKNRYDIVDDWLKKNKNVPNRFFYQKRYDSTSNVFEDLPDVDDVELQKFCSNCSRKWALEDREVPLPTSEPIYNEETKEYVIKKVCWREEKFCVGSGVFLFPGSLFECETTSSGSPKKDESNDDIQIMYPEIYRKKKLKKRDKAESKDPFDIGFISRIFSKKKNIRKPSDVRIEVKKLYRPQNTHLEKSEADREDLNKLYWSEEECSLKFDQVEGKCFLACAKNFGETIDKWSERGPNRFYFMQAYDAETKRFLELPSYATIIGKVVDDDANVPRNWPAVKPLATLDVFTGCGGLSEGLRQSGAAECRWGIEKEAAPARAFQLNNPKAKVFQDDCNNVLRKLMNPRTTKCLELPKRGEVDLLCGGPPCQGFSSLNRHPDGKDAKFKNSLVATYLSYCDHFRPRFFVLENVRELVNNSDSMVFKTTLSCLVRMGYQVGFSVLQCAMYGIPQGRRRIIILAAAPGEIMPKFPEPTHTFPDTSRLYVTINDQKYMNNLLWTESAPYRTLTVNDAISDLPKIENNDNKTRMYYQKKAQTHFQKKMRWGVDLNAPLKEHTCKKFHPLILKRISYVPPDGDWRDIPNIEVRLSNGSMTKKLKYTHNDYKCPKTSKGHQLSGVCACATRPGAKCNQGSRQKDTLIPWSLVHTSNRPSNNQWSNAYGRASSDSYFQTLVTNPDPKSKQGRVIHPDQDRIVSIREYARLQGFKDSYQFYGDISDKYAQIGNAVAPTLGKAIGLEICKSVAAKKEKELWNIIP